MKNYNDEILCPEKFEQMAKEYNHLKKQIVIKKIEHNMDVKLSLINKIKNNASDILSNVEYLYNFKLSNNTKNHLYKLKICCSEIETSLLCEKTKLPTTNFCQTLQNTILMCTKSITSILNLQNYCTENEYEIYYKLLNQLVTIIDNLSLMFGTCKYRKI